MLSALPMIVSGMAGALFVVSANAWMNNPAGFRLDADGRVTDAEPWAAMFGPSTAPQVVHMLLAAHMVTGFTVASVYAVGMLRGRRVSSPAHRFQHRRCLVTSLAAAQSLSQTVSGCQTSRVRHLSVLSARLAAG